MQQADVLMPRANHVSPSHRLICERDGHLQHPRSCSESNPAAYVSSALVIPDDILYSGEPLDTVLIMALGLSVLERRNTLRLMGGTACQSHQNVVMWSP